MSSGVSNFASGLLCSVLASLIAKTSTGGGSGKISDACTISILSNALSFVISTVVGLSVTVSCIKEGAALG